MKIIYSSESRDDRLLCIKGDNFNLDLESRDIDLLKKVLMEAGEITDINLIDDEHKKLITMDSMQDIILPELQKGKT